jgi:hypothetical protein
LIDDDVAEIDADAKADALLLGGVSLAVEHAALRLDGAAHGIDHAGKLGQHAVAGALDDAAFVLADLRVDKFAAVRLEAAQGAFLVRPHQTRIAGHIRSEDGCEPARDPRLAQDALRRTTYTTFALICSVHRPVVNTSSLADGPNHRRGLQPRRGPATCGGRLMEWTGCFPGRASL